MATTISVNGSDGTVLALSSGIHLEHGDAEALVLRNRQAAATHILPGRNAPQAIPGGPAGTLAVQLTESTTSQGAITVRVIRSSQIHSLPPITEVPTGRELRLTALGGIGESGQNGGDGQQGLDGIDGAPASRGTDATRGTDGGNGGDGGRGSDGADGGPGGDIHVIMNENSTHLLMCVSWDMRGGAGGRPGQHGRPGLGGTGGQGGMGWQWEEIVGYRYFCTTSCIKTNVQEEPSTLVRVGSQLNAGSSRMAASTMSMIAPLRAYAVSGTDLQHFITQAAVAYRAVRMPRTDPGACRCGGGRGNCAGCDMKPIRHQFKRAPGLVGKDGENGTTITDQLIKGRKGLDGTILIVIQHTDGTTQQYTSPWKLELVDFDIEDGNADGIFEPGEYLYIRRVKVRNVGGMPSPTCLIPVSLAGHCDWLEEVGAEHGGVAYLPTSIPATGEAVMEGSIKVQIRSNRRPLIPGRHFAAKGWLQIRADMPWLERQLPSFDRLRKEIHISYPCRFGDLHHLDTITRGSLSSIQYEVSNKGNQPVGEPSDTTGRFFRAMEVSVSVPAPYGRLISGINEDNLQLDEIVPCVRPRDFIRMQQNFRVLSAAENHKHFSITFDLYLESPEPVQNDIREMVLVDRRVCRLQVSSAYIQKPNAKFLIVTNPKITERQSQALQGFIHGTLNMEVDLCNIHQNGGLVQTTGDDFGNRDTILQNYHGKTAIFLDNSFEFFDPEAKTISHLCDPSWLHELATNRSSSLFVGISAESAFDALVYRSIHPSTLKCEDAINHVKPSQFFDTPEHFVESVMQESMFAKAETRISAIKKRSKWYHSKKSADERYAKAVQYYLRNRLPNERFMISYDSGDYLIVVRGLGQQHSFLATESPITVQPLNDSDTTQYRLDRYSKFLIVSAIPFHQRADLLWRNTYSNASLLIAITLSMIQDLAEQIQGLQTSHNKSLLRVANHDLKAAETTVRTHLPFLWSLVNHPQAGVSSQPPDSVVHVLQWVFALASNLRRHRSLKALVTLLLLNRTSTATLVSLPAFQTGIATCEPMKLIDHISELTATPPYRLRKGQKSGNDVVGKTQFVTPNRWDAMTDASEKDRERLMVVMERARTELERMSVEQVAMRPIDIAVELPD